MKSILSTVVLLFFAQIVLAQGKLELTINNIIIDNGNIRVALYNSENQFLKHPFRVKKAESNSEIIKIIFSDIPKGYYAISLFQDENSDEELNRGMFGPKEPYGFSNNAKGSFGPAKYEDAKFEVVDGEMVKQSINLN